MNHKEYLKFATEWKFDSYDHYMWGRVVGNTQVYSYFIELYKLRRKMIK